MYKYQRLHVFPVLLAAVVILGFASRALGLPAYTITAIAAGDGEGEIYSSDSSIHFYYPTAGSGTSSPIDEGVYVFLEAHAEALISVVSWNDCEAQGGISSGNGTSNATCTFLALDADKTVNATFTRNASKVTVNAAGDGSGIFGIGDPAAPLSGPHTYPDTPTATTDWIVNGSDVTVYAEDPSEMSLVTFSDCESQGGSSIGNGTSYATCTFPVLDADKTVNATFTWNASKVTVNAAGDGSGTYGIVDPAVPPSPPYSYPDTPTATTDWIVNGSDVTVYAEDPSEMSLITFPDCESQGGSSIGNGTSYATCTFPVLDADKTVNATFTWNASKVTVNAAGDGSGTYGIVDPAVPPSPPYSYPDTPTATTDWIVNGSDVTVYAEDPSEMSLISFADCESQGGSSIGNGTSYATCTFPVLDADKTVNATFTWNASKVTVNAAGDGSGTYGIVDPAVPLSPPYSYPDTPTATTDWIVNGSDVTVYAEDPSEMSLISLADCESQGGSSIGNGTPQASCNFGVLQGNVTLTATYTLISYNLTVNLAGRGSGTVTSGPSGIDCGTDCNETYGTGTVVKLTATPDPGSSFAGWSGDGDCSDGEVIISGDLNCTANFTRFPWNLFLPIITGSEP